MNDSRRGDDTPEGLTVGVLRQPGSEIWNSPLQRDEIDREAFVSCLVQTHQGLFEPVQIKLA